MRNRKVIATEATDCDDSGLILEVLLDIRDELVELRKELAERDMETFRRG